MGELDDESSQDDTTERERPAHWRSTYKLPDDMPPPGSRYPNWGPQFPEVVALGVCQSCGWIHTRCKAHAKTHGGAPCMKVRRLGQLVCGNHGGNRLATLDAARRRDVRAQALNEAGALIAEAQLVVEGRSGEEQLMAAITQAGAMAQSYRWLLDQLPLESEWSYQEVSGDSGAPQRWVNVAEQGLLGPDAKGEMKLHAYEEGLRHWTALHGRLLVEAAKIGLDERRQLFAEQQVARIGDAIVGLVAGLGHQLDDPRVVPVVEAALRQIAGPDHGAIEATARPAVDLDDVPLFGGDE